MSIIYSGSERAIYTYIIDHYNPLVRITPNWLTPFMLFVCVNFICKGRDLQFNVDPERQIFEKLLQQDY